MAQVTVMWSVKQGVGLADTMWSHTADHLSQKGGAVMSPPTSDYIAILVRFAAPQTGVSMQNLMLSAACLAVLDKSGHEAIAKYQRGSNAQPLPAFTPMVRVGTEFKATTGKNHICFGTESHQRYVDRLVGIKIS